MRAAAHRYGLTAFWRWWVDQLAPLAPPALATALARRRLRPVLAFETDSIVVWNPVLRDSSMAFAEAARIPRGTDANALRDAGRAAIGRLPGAPYGQAAAAPRVVVSLPRGEVLRKQFTLPAAVERDLLQTLAYDLDRHTPFKPDELYFDATVVARDPVKKEIRVDWAAARRTVVDQAVRQAGAFGATVVAVTPEITEAQGPSTRLRTKLNLLSDDARPSGSLWRRWQLWVPLALIAIFALIAIVLPLWQKRAYTLALLKVTSEARVHAEASSALRMQLEQQAADYNFVLGKKYAYPSAMQVIEDVTKLMPDDTWITQLEVKSATKGKEPYREMMLKGESANAGRLVSLLEDSHEFLDAAPRSPTMKIQPGPGEIFDFAARVKPLSPPAAIEIATTAPVTSPVPSDAAPTPPANASAGPPPAAGAAADAAAPVPGAAAPGPTTSAPTTPAATTSGAATAGDTITAPPAAAPPAAAPPAAAAPAAAAPAAAAPAAPPAAPPPAPGTTIAPEGPPPMFGPLPPQMTGSSGSPPKRRTLAPGGSK